MGFMSRNLPAPRMMMSKMKQLRRARHEEAMLNLQISQQLKQEQEQQTMMMKTTTMKTVNASDADSPAMAMMDLDYSHVPPHLRHLPPRIVKRRLLLLHHEMQHSHEILQQNPCLGSDTDLSPRFIKPKPEHSDDESKFMVQKIQHGCTLTCDEPTTTTSSTQEEQEQEQEQKLMEMMIEELRYHEAAATPPASLVYTEYLQVDDRSILSLLPNEVVAILPATLNDEDKTLMVVLQSRKQ